MLEWVGQCAGPRVPGAGITRTLPTPTHPFSHQTSTHRRGITISVEDGNPPNGPGAKFREDFFNFYDELLLGGPNALAWASQPHPEVTAEFFRLLALCNTVIPDGGWGGWRGWAAARRAAWAMGGGGAWG